MLKLLRELTIYAIVYWHAYCNNQMKTLIYFLNAQVEQRTEGSQSVLYAWLI